MLHELFHFYPNEKSPVTPLWFFSRSPGALYPDGTGPQDKHGDKVDPGKSYTYHWQLPSNHAPAEDDTNCLTRLYHSHTSAPKDIASGLVGPLIICKKGTGFSLDDYGNCLCSSTFIFSHLVDALIQSDLQ